MVSCINNNQTLIQSVHRNCESKITKLKNDCEKFKNIEINKNELYGKFNRFRASELKIPDLIQKRADFGKKYGDNPWIKTAVVVFALAIIGLSMYGVVKIVNASHAWINAPRLPGELYSNLETFCFYSVMTFGIGAMVFLAIPGVPILILTASAMLVTPMVFFPKDTIMKYAPSAEKDIRFNEVRKNDIKRILKIDDDQFEELKGKINDILGSNKTDEQKKDLVISCLRDHVSNFAEELKWQEDYIADLNMERRQDNDDE